MIKCIAFDLDGTLVNSLADLADASNHALSELGFPQHDVNEYRHFVGSGVKVLFERALPPEQRTEKNIAEGCRIFEKYYNQCYCNQTRPYEMISEVLERLQDEHFKLAVISNKPDSFVHTIVETLFPEIDFDYISGATDDVPKKPAPDALVHCMEALHMKPENCFYCGDSDVDVLFAHNAEIPIAGAAWGFRGIDELEHAGADYIINHPTDLLAILDILN